MVKELTREMLWEAGAQFGHQTKRWNPKMKPYIYGEKNKIHIIDLQQTIWRLEDVKKLMAVIASKKGKILFVGTKKQAKWIVKDAAERSENFYVNQRWLGGTLTNLKTIHLRVKRLWNIERQEKSGELKWLPKKEQILIKKEKDKLEKFLGGIKGMKELPQALFVVDPKEEHIAVREARKLRIPVIAICDTNVDPDGIDYVIPGNDDTVRSIAILTHYVADLYGDAMGLKMPEPQFKPSEFKREFNNDNRNNNDRRGNYQRSEDRNVSEPRNNHPAGNNSEQPAAKVNNEPTVKLEVKPTVEPQAPTKAEDNQLSTITVVDNDLEKSLAKLTVAELETIGKPFAVKKGKKANMISALIPHLNIVDGKITTK
ncbi:30S ribosomal protein S2 [Spiroplasma mirum ATCC 29335]|uniref:Small ribosomal subunit protein uS2 n=1 Tax=Spiroplasma mirum ATCC 29335 TaxID=838561 RepID=W0GR68_9MOLU|nr:MULTISPECIES: 30S ribosomal protein S2 [Spiroplasma]AHF61114.1 30S ribosomal protein S2 [Spiroplasma mirum ATCC 29335]AHI57369.1 30S ribosomal protein S2 [Spiroplasma mirum ATCC 29335]AKM53214.1 30S ribosomal protein S2 [Spiroplasma atrichopogonis]